MGYTAEVEIRRRLELHAPDYERAAAEAENRLDELRERDDVDRAIVLEIDEVDADEED